MRELDKPQHFNVAQTVFLLALLERAGEWERIERILAFALGEASPTVRKCFQAQAETLRAQFETLWRRDANFVGENWTREGP